MRFIRLTLFIALAGMLAACGAPSKFKTYNGPEITSVLVDKSDRKMYLMHHQKVEESYDIGLGFQPEGHKQFEGDGRTPEGMYFIDRRNPNSNFHLSIGLSYPNPYDRAFAASMGKSPGGDIFIHGGPPKDSKNRKQDWTWGCIALTDKQIEDVYAMVQDGTPIYIQP